MNCCETAPAVVGAEPYAAAECAGRALRRLVGFVASALDVRFAFVVALDPSATPSSLTLWLARDYGLRTETSELTGPVVQGSELDLAPLLRQALPCEPELAGITRSHCVSLPLFDSSRRLVGHLGVVDPDRSCRFSARDRLAPLARRASEEVARWLGVAG
jgi:hypothetical protein